MPPQVPQAPRKVKRSRAIADILLEFEDWQKEFVRAYATYRTLNSSLESFTLRQQSLATGQPIQETEDRLKGLPIFKVPVSADGRTMIEANIDLRDIDPAYVPHVMIPIINAQSGKMLEALEEIAIRVGELKNALMPAATGDGTVGVTSGERVFVEPAGSEEE